MIDKWDLLTNELGEIRLKRDESLHYHTGSNYDIIAEGVYVATLQKELIHVLNSVHELDIPFMVLGFDNIKLPKKQTKLASLVIKNRTHLIKISGIKGKFIVGSMGIDQVLLEVDSGVSLEELNSYLLTNKLLPIFFTAEPKTTIAESFPIEFSLQGMVETIKVWEKGAVEEVNVLEFNSKKHILISIIIRVKSNSLI